MGFNHCWRVGKHFISHCWRVFSLSESGKTFYLPLLESFLTVGVIYDIKKYFLVFNITYEFLVVVEFGLPTRKSGKPRTLKPRASPSVLINVLLPTRSSPSVGNNTVSHFFSLVNPSFFAFGKKVHSFTTWPVGILQFHILSNFSVFATFTVSTFHSLNSSQFKLST